MAAYLYFEFESNYTFPSADGWSLFTSLSSGTGGSGILNEWSVSALFAATNYTFDSATVVDLGGGQYRYTAIKNVAEGYDLNDLSQDYPATLTTFVTNGIWLAVRLYDSSTIPTDLTICDECLDVTYQACVDTYKIVAGLDLATDYYVAIEDRNGDVYTQLITSDSNGDLTIDATAPEFPVGFWLAESGNKVVKFYSDEELTEVVSITVGPAVYTCVQMNLQYRYTTTTSITPDFNYMVDDTFNFYIDNSSNSYILS